MPGDEVGVKFSNGCRITHGTGGNIKHPFSDIPTLVMHELSPSNHKGFTGQLGFIEFTSDIRLPRHVHMTENKKTVDFSKRDIDSPKYTLVDERIMVLSGVGIVEIAGELYVTAPGTLVDAVGGVPHTWSACPAGVKLPDGTVSNGKFTMVYEYESATAFYPTKSTTPITDASQYEAFEGDNYDEIRFPELTAEQVTSQAEIVFNTSLEKLTLAE